MSVDPISSGDSSATGMTAAGSSTTSTADAVAANPSGASAGSEVMTAFLESVRATVRDEIRRHTPGPSATESSYPPTSLAGPSGVSPGAEAPLPPATATAGPSGASTGKYMSGMVMHVKNNTNENYRVPPPFVWGVTSRDLNR